MKNLVNMIFVAIFLSVCGASAEDIDLSQSIRMNQLLPRNRFSFSLGVEPKLPDNFVCMESNDNSDLGIYWGPAEVLQAFFKDPDSLTVPIIRAELSFDVTQELIDNVGSRKKSLIEKTFQEEEDINSTVTFGNWGIYPFCKIHIPNRQKYMALIGTNSDGHVLALDLIVPRKKIFQSSNFLEVWDQFFEETRLLPEPLFFKAMGQELHTGYTIVNVVEKKIKVVAERRKSDHLIRFTVIPLDEGVVFNFSDAIVTQMGAPWHFGDPQPKIHATYIIDENWVHWSMVTLCLIRNVDEFAALLTDNPDIY